MLVEEAPEPVDTWLWADAEVPDEQLPDPPRIPQRFNLSLLRREEIPEDVTGATPDVDMFWDLEVADEESSFENFPHACPLPRPFTKKLGTVQEEEVVTIQDSLLKARAPLTVYCDDSYETCSFVEKVADLMERVSSNIPNELDGTINPTPRSPPVVGRLSKAAEAGKETTFQEVSVPMLKSAMTSQAKEGHAMPLPGEEVQPGSKAAAAEDGLIGEAPSIYDMLRNQFADINRENKRYVTVADFMQFVEWRTRRSGGVPADFDRLLQETAKRCFGLASVRGERLRSEDWLHFGLLSSAAPWQLNRRLRRELVKNPQFLKQVLHAFETADVRGVGRLHLKDIKASFANCQELIGQVELAAKNPGQSQELSYYDFVAYCLGYRRSMVKLNWYDVSRGYAKWVPGTLLGQDLEGIWHTGVVAFGREYWFGGKVLASDPGKAPFAGPIRCTELGSTLHTREELEDWLRFEVVSRYTRETYDVLMHNCNHFSDEVSAFLIEGCHIPDEARRQPEALMGTSTIEMVRPILNRWLGGFEGRGDSAEIDDLTEEWRARLWPGDLCLYDQQSASGAHQLKLAQVSNVDVFSGVCDISFFDSDGEDEDDRVKWTMRAIGVSSLQRFPDLSRSWDWRLVKKSVPLSSLRPHESVGSLGNRGRGALLRPGLRKIDPDIQSILKRKAVVYAHCAQGHSMQPSDRQWSIASLIRSKLSNSCGICSKDLVSDRRLECTVCGFYLCSACDRKGLFRGYYSLGSIAAPTARQLLQEPSWIAYKAQRYLAAAGKPGGPLSLDIWQGKLAVRIYGDLGQDLPCKEELVRQFRQHSDSGDGSTNLNLTEDQFRSLLSEMLAAHSFMYHL